MIFIYFVAHVLLTILLINSNLLPKKLADKGQDQPLKLNKERS